MKYKCSKELYTAFITATAERYSAQALSEVSPIELSHDAVSRWLASKTYTPSDIWKETSVSVIGKKGCILADDSVLDKSRSEKIELVNWQYSGNVHGTIKRIGVLNFVWTDGDTFTPFDYRIYNPPEDGKTKNDHFKDMLSLGKKRGVTPEYVIADSWYSSLDNVKAVRNHGWHWVMGLRKNRSVNKNEKLENLTIPEEGLVVHLKGYGWIKVFRFVGKNTRTDYIGTSDMSMDREKVKECFGGRWDIEVYHRELKQEFMVECCQSYTGRAQRNHIALSMIAWIKQRRRKILTGHSVYQMKWNSLKPSITTKIQFYLKN